MQAADLGLSFAGEDDNASTKLLEDTKAIAQQQLLLKVLRGRWKGSVDPTLGGYEQTFQFGDSSNNGRTLGKQGVSSCSCSSNDSDMQM